MIATQFTDQQWNKMISPAILYGPEGYQGLAFKNPYFFQEIIHIIALMTESVCNSSTGKLLRTSAKAFRVEIGIPFFLTSTPYDECNL